MLRHATVDVPDLTTVLADGCARHELTPAQVAEWWRIAEKMDARVQVCLCCFGPAPASGWVVCMRCGPLTDELLAGLVEEFNVAKIEHRVAEAQAEPAEKGATS